MRGLERCVLEFFITLLDHAIGDNEFQNALYSGLAVLGIDVAHGWRSALVYTPRLSAIVTVARMLVLYKAKQERDDEIEQRRAEGETQQEAQQNARSHFDRVREMVQRFMTIVAFDGQPSPMDSILRLRAYGKAIRANTNADGVVDWHGDELLYGHVQFSMASLRMMVHGLLHSARAQLRQEVLLIETDGEGEAGEGMPQIQWDRLVDNAAETRAGWSFVDDRRNHDAWNGVDGKLWLAGRVAAEEQLRRQFMETDSQTGSNTSSKTSGGTGLRWKMDRVHEYAEAMKSFRSKLLVLMHMSGGQPARGTELVTVQYKNGVDGDIRGLFIDDRSVVFVTMYNKTMGMSAKAKVIHRYLPREVGELAVYYVWLAVPFWRMVVTGASHGKADWSSPYIWEPRKETAWVFPGEEDEGQGQDHEYKRVPKRKRTARDLPSSRRGEKRRRVRGPPAAAIGMATMVIDEVEEAEARESDPDGYRGTQSTACEPETWEPEMWDTMRVGRAIADVSLKHMGEKLGIMVWRHAVKAIYRRYIKDKSIIDIIDHADTTDGGGEPDDHNSGAGDPFHGQSGHGAGVGEGIYGRSVGESLYSTEARRLGFRRVSREWHAFLMFDSVLQEVGKKKTSRLQDVESQATIEENRRWKLMRQIDIREQLQQILGQEAAFRGVQEPALQAIMKQESPVVVVMGTGGGKSMLFMLPARCSSGLTVVVVPLVSLRSDIKDRCDQLGIE
ncbi:hypothetical protein QBC36DRAFT_226075, partial [Triangularia setosa]